MFWGNINRAFGLWQTAVVNAAIYIGTLSEDHLLMLIDSVGLHLIDWKPFWQIGSWRFVDLLCRLICTTLIYLLMYLIVCDVTMWVVTSCSHLDRFLVTIMYSLKTIAQYVVCMKHCSRYCQFSRYYLFYIICHDIK